ncbi:hypothetical protein ABT039_12120 [Streptomyces lasiicapitis]|uniref:hypothetical protein n=1 Tax=Streptomyces lasiicapitis TaxID=1923961 RepID=UPI003324ABC0
MVQYLDNPAGRLHKLLLDLHSATPNDQQQKNKQAWMAIVELIDTGASLAREASIVGAVVALPGQIRDAVAGLDEDQERKDHLLSHLDEVEGGMSQVLSRQSLYAMFTTFATGGVVPQAAAINSLSHCSWALHSDARELTISDDDLARIIEMIKSLMTEIAEAELPSNVKRAMLNHLAALLQAAHDVRFAGTQPLDDALFALMGATGRTGAREDLDRVGLWARLQNAVQTVGDMLSTGESAAQIGQGITGVLGG